MAVRTIRKAVFPIAGLGTRFLPVTKASPKEMLPIVDKPLIQYAVEEAYAAGIRQMIFVTGRGKRAVEDHFDVTLELEMELEASEKHDLLALVRSIKPHDMECVYVRQPRALGLGHAVLCAEKLIGDEAFAVLLADDLIVGKTPALVQMIDQFTRLQSSIIAVQNIPRSHAHRYGVVTGELVHEKLMHVQNIIEKPETNFALSTLGVVGRYILSPSIFKELSNQTSGVNGEIQLTDSIELLLQYEPVFAYAFDGVRYDCGSKLGFLQATVDLAEHNVEIGLEFSNWIKKRKIIHEVTD